MVACATTKKISAPVDAVSRASPATLASVDTSSRLGDSQPPEPSTFIGPLRRFGIASPKAPSTTPVDSRRIEV